MFSIEEEGADGVVEIPEERWVILDAQMTVTECRKDSGVLPGMMVGDARAELTVWSVDRFAPMPPPEDF